MCSVYFPFKHETNIACWLFWCLVFFIYPPKNIFHCKFVIQYDGCVIPRCLSTVGNSGEKLLLCQSLLFVSHCFAVRNLDGKMEQLCFRVQFCVLLRYLRVNETKSWRNIWFAPDFRFSLSLNDSGSLRSMTCIKILV